MSSTYLLYTTGLKSGGQLSNNDIRIHLLKANPWRLHQSVYIKCSMCAFIAVNPSQRLSTRLDNELDINIKLSINVILYVITLPFLSFFFMEY